MSKAIGLPSGAFLSWSDYEWLLKNPPLAAEAIRAEYVCESQYGPYANAMVNCKECGWPIGNHHMAVLKGFGPGPFRPPQDVKHD